MFYRLVVAIARDLQKDFYEYFPPFLSEMICSLQTKDAEQIEYTFKALAYLFKFLWRYLTRNIETVVLLLLPLLTDTQPVYINRFAAESFAFIVRKVKDKDSFLKLMLNILNDNASAASGCGKLLFEVVSGTPGQFHSCAEQMLQLYFNGLQDKSVDRKLTYQALNEVVVCTLQNVYPQKYDIMWSVMLQTIDKFVESSKQSLETSEEEHEESLVMLLSLICIIIKYKNGKFLTDALPLTRKLIVMIEQFNQDNNILREVINVSVAIFLAPDVKLMQENSNQLLLKIMTVNNVELLHFTVENLIHCSLFEMLVLPRILKRSISIGFDNKALLLFAKIISEKASPCLSGITLDKWKKYVLDIRNIGIESINYFLHELETLSADVVSLDAVRILIILPHLKPLHEKFKDMLENGLLSLYEKVSKYNSVENIVDINKTTFIFLLILESLMHISEPNNLHEFLTRSNIKLIDLIVTLYDNKYILYAVDLCLTYFAASQCHAYYINSVSFDMLHNSIVVKMSSPYSNIRLTVAHIYSLFANVEGLKCSVQNDKSALELVYLAECEPATVQKYRGKLLYLQALEYQSYAIDNFDLKYLEFPLRCLIGNLYINFSLLWEPVSTVIASYGKKEFPQFWPTFLAELTSKNEAEVEWKPSFDCDIVSSLAVRAEKCEDKPDFENHKILLWKCMTHFSYYAETKNRDLTGLFIDFVNTNFFKSNSEDSKACNIEKRKETDVNNDVKEDENDDDEEDDENIIIAKAIQTDTKNRNCKRKLLIAQMEIFEKVLNPKTLYREAEMRQIYLDLLSSKNADIQKAALNCLFAYKHKYLLPYKESLYGLINEKNLKNELARFKLESNVIQEEHREDLVPIIMRIVYAKMIIKTGMRTGGKAGGFVRRKMILRFLAGTREDEMITFVKMAFRPFKLQALLEMDEAFDLKRHVEGIVDTIDLKNVTPPKRMQSAVNLLAIMVEQFGGKMSARLLPRLLGILISILAEVTGILQRTQDVYVGYLSAIKSVRTNGIGVLARFFAHFEDYDWRGHEIDALYDVAVFPWLRKLPVEGIHSPTSLLKLFMAWSQNSRYYPLLVKHRESDESLNPLLYVVQLLSNPNAHPSVINAILEMIEKILTLQDYGKYSEDTAMRVDEPFLPLTPVVANIIEVDEKVLSAGVNYGSAILLPHVPRILDFMKNKIKKTNKGVSKIELSILSRISEFATDAETCDTLLVLILPILVKTSTHAGNNEETVMSLLTTVINLIKILNRPEIHLRAVAPLIGYVSDVAARKLLIQLYGIIVEKSAEEHRETLMRDCRILTALNAWDRRWIDQPDFQKRLDAFQEINGIIERNAITLEFGVAIIYNCYYFLKTESDLAMRDYAGQGLRLVCSSLVKEHKGDASNRRYLLDDTILALVRKGIVSKNETIHLRSIALLGHMASECADAHPILRDLSLLVNRVDPEVDFFENMQHLQLHRKARALLKFCALAKSTSDKPMSPKTLTKFILPLCSLYLCNEAYAHKNSVIDAAIETVGVACRLLPWYHYEIVLRHYLDKLKSSVEFQKQLVRIIVTILDSFHSADRPNIEGRLNGLLPQLHQAITARTRRDSNHKINRKKIASEIEEDDLLRVPIALALVKLLQNMSVGLLDANLPAIFMKLCIFLKSRMESVRRATREILQKIMITLGPKYLHHLLQEMNTLLTKGFQVHVLVYTIQSVLSALKPYFQKLDINYNLQSILSVCKVDLFGLTAEEHEIVGIVKSVSEAKSTKSFDIFHILAEFITESCLLDLILPLKEMLMTTRSHKTIHKIVECLRNVTLGLADNTYIPLEQMLIFLYGIISESIPSLMPEKENKRVDEKPKLLTRQKADCFIIPLEPKSRIGIKATAKTAKSTNIHVMVEFGLKLFHILLKRDKVPSLEYKSYLEPFVSLLSSCLSSQHVKVCIKIFENKYFFYKNLIYIYKICGLR